MDRISVRFSEQQFRQRREFANYCRRVRRERRHIWLSGCSKNFVCDPEVEVHLILSRAAREDTAYLEMRQDGRRIQSPGAL